MELSSQIDAFSAQGKLPRVLGPYRLLRWLGEGQNGTVFEAERIAFTQRLAIKVFHADFPSGGQSQSGEDLVAGFDHRNIVRSLDRGQAAEGPYLAMELVEGVALDAFCEEKTLSLPKRLQLALQVMDAVEYAHRRQVVHCDLKPANILVTRDGEAKLLDFGTAALLSAAGTAQPSAYTPAYASPEYRLGAGISIASDIYALGLLTRELLGVSPGAARDVPASALLHLDPNAASLAAQQGLSAASLERALRGDLDSILAKALAFDPAARYLSVQAFADDLRAYLEGRSVTARQTGTLERGRKWVLRHLLLSSLTALLLITLAGSAAGVMVETARANVQRARAESQLHELVKLTGTLDGELYESVRTLPQADASRASLLQSTAATLDALAISGSRNKALSAELAAQYERLAQLEAQQPATQASSRLHSEKAKALRAR